MNRQARERSIAKKALQRATAIQIGVVGIEAPLRLTQEIAAMTAALSRADLIKVAGHLAMFGRSLAMDLPPGRLDQLLNEIFAAVDELEETMTGARP